MPDVTATFSAARLTALFPKARLHERGLMSILSSAGLRSTGKGYELMPAIEAIIAHYKRQSERTNEARERDKDRQIAADAETAEINAAKAKDQILMRKDVELIWADYFAQNREAIAHMPGITDKQRKVVTEKLLMIKLSEDICRKARAPLA